MSDFVCEYCGWNKGKTENSLRAHVNLHCKENPNRKQPDPVLESEGAGLQPEAPAIDKDAEIERLREELKQIKASQGLTELGEELEFPNGARYRNVGRCIECHTPLYRCITHPLRDDGAVGNRLAVQVKGARAAAPMPGEEGIPQEPPTLYCLTHDPTKHLRHSGKARRPGEPMAQEDWQPLQVRL